MNDTISKEDAIELAKLVGELCINVVLETLVLFKITNPVSSANTVIKYTNDKSTKPSIARLLSY